MSFPPELLRFRTGPDLPRFRAGPDLPRFRAGPDLPRFRAGPDLPRFRAGLNEKKRSKEKSSQQKTPPHMAQRCLVLWHAPALLAIA